MCSESYEGIRLMMTPKPKRQYLITLFIILMASAIIILDLSMLQEQVEPVVEPEVFTPVQPLPSEAGVFTRDEYALAYLNMPDDPQYQRTLTTYYRNRAYYGAPPTIPHTVLDEKSFGGKACLQCHQNGGFVARFNAFAPVTPHPERINCKQCHVPSRVETLFMESNFTKLEPSTIGNHVLQGSPPIIPHALQNRENCLACHAGPASPKEIRVTHPERLNCRQCHATKPLLNIEWVRPSTEMETKQ
jgi:cytochrome c-type protein NapB